MVEVDSPYAWLVCGASFCTLFITLGLHYSCGVIFIALLEHFDESKAKTAWVQSISQFMIFFSCSFASALVDRYGARVVAMTGGLLMSVGLLASSFVNQLNVLYFTYGIVFGLGTSLAYLPTLVMVGQYFEKRRAVATGIATSGSNVGALSLAIIQETILKRFGWRHVFRFTGGFSLLVIICGIIFRPLVSKNKTLVPKQKWSLKKKVTMLMRNKKFLLWSIATTSGCFGYFIPHVHLIRFAEDQGFSSKKATFLIIYMSVGSGIGKLIFGKISDLLPTKTTEIYSISMFLSGLSSVLFSFSSTSYAGLIAYTTILGLLDGSYIGLMSIMAFKCAGSVEMMSQSWGMSLMFMSFSMLVGPPTVGWLKCYGAAYKCLFYLAGVPMIVGSLILVPILWIKEPIVDLRYSDNSIVLINDLNANIQEEKLTVV